MTSKTKSYILRKDTRNTKSSPTSGQDSISKEKDLMPYWNESCKELSEKLLLLTETDSVDSVSICSNKSVLSVEQTSWFVTKLLAHQSKSWSETSSLLSTSFPVDSTVSENMLVRSAKIRIYPSSESESLFNRFNGLSRYWYNRAVESLKKPGTKASLYDLRSLQSDPTTPSWALDCPQRIREHAFSDAANAVIRAKKTYKKTKKIQCVKYRSKRNPKQGFGFDLASLNEKYLFSNKKWRLHFHVTEELKHVLKQGKEGTRVVKENDRWFIVVPRTVQQKISETQREKYVALDPGVRTFMTLFSPTITGKIGEGDFSRIYRLCLNMDKLISSSFQAKGLKRLNKKRAIRRMRWKIKDLINDLHHKTAHFLCSNFETILIPTFETSDMVKKGHRKIRSKTARSMLTFAHFRFKEFLKAEAEKVGSRVVEVNEAYTSKTCSFCGKIQDIGSKRIMKCSCGAVCDRDINGARGIYLRALRATSVPELAFRDATAELGGVHQC